MPPPEEQIVLVLNSGSSSLKFGCFRVGDGDTPSLLLQGSAEGIGRPNGSLHIHSAAGESLSSEEHLLESQEDALGKLATALIQHLASGPSAVGHRVVHGGPHLREHQKITPEILAELRAAVHFAPLHIPQAVALIEQAQRIFATCPHFACFDNAFHRTMPEVAAHLPLPSRFFEQGVIRYGFHGLSCESILAQLGPNMAERIVIAHLGSGSSVTAVHRGRSIDTSMGLTPTGGVPMGTRSGDLDPGVLFFLMRSGSLDADALEQMLNHQCGLAGFSDGESDMQALLTRVTQGEAKAELAVTAFTIAIRKYIAGYATLMGGIDLLVLTGGIGQHSAEIRSRISTGLDFLGLGPQSDKVRPMPAQEELQIARHCETLLKTANHAGHAEQGAAAK